jgi:acetylornithine/succinyldiaminopimelate/putrescine aminotransferase
MEDIYMRLIKKLQDIRSEHKFAETQGIEDSFIEQFLEKDPRLSMAIEDAVTHYSELKHEFGNILRHEEAFQIHEIQRDYLNFYEEFNINPYVALTAKGPWIVTSCGAVIYDTGGYGMLGFGHNPDFILHALAKPQVMANIMTPNLSQWRFAKRLQEEIGHHRTDGQKYFQFLCVNSGSEATTVACRIADHHAKHHTDAGGTHAGKKIMYLSLKGSFHGRTDPSAQLSNSSLPVYQENLASFRDRRNLVTVEPNNIAELKQVFSWAEQEGIFLQAMFLEPVMGEGNPGKAITPEFYKIARELTKKYDCLLVVDSIQAGLRTNACLSIVDYPGFESFAFPDMEAFSKALNGGQFPFSLLALNEKSAKLYKYGLYGNTMTSNPRALDVASQILKNMTPEIRENIHRQGAYFIKELNTLAAQFSGLITTVQGTGLLFSVGFDEKRCQVLGEKGLERYLRRKGLGVIHGGKNALRFTPVFDITKDAADLILTILKKALHEFVS